MVAKGRGGGKTPQRVVDLVNQAVSEKSLRSVSKETGLGIAALSRYSQGIGEPSQATLEKLASYFNLSVAELRGKGELYSVGYSNGEVLFRLRKDKPDEVIIGFPEDVIIRIGTKVVASILDGSTPEELLEDLHPYKRAIEESAKKRNGSL